MRRGRKIGGALRRILATGALLLATASPAAADTLVVQPDGKIVLAGRTSPEFGALARLHADGSLDQSFGQGGFAIDHRAPAFAALDLQPDGRIVAGAFGGSVIARYLSDGGPDPTFSDDGIGGTPEPRHFRGFFSDGSPIAVVTRPGGTIAVAEAPLASRGGGRETRLRHYDAQGNLLETIGSVVRRRPGAGAAITELVEQANGALVGAGSIHGSEGPKSYTRPLLARFLPGSGSAFDASFGSGAGLVRPRVGTTDFRSTFTALAAAGDKLIAAGQAEKTFLVARFDGEGNLDSSFGEGGFATPAIVGTAKDFPGHWESPSSGANDVAVAPGGDVILGGGTSRWGEWTFGKTLPQCSGCPQPMLARFDSSGRLDPSFGQDGLLRLKKPDGSLLEGEIEQVTALPDGKILVNGLIGGGRRTPFVARLKPDGGYDGSFGAGGLVTPEFPCTDQPREQLEQAGCLASATMRLRLRGLRHGSPVISMALSAGPSWAGIDGVFLALPWGIRPARKLSSRTALTTVAGSGRGEVHVIGSGRGQLLFNEFGSARKLRVTLRRGSLVITDRKLLRRRPLRLRVTAMFSHATWGTWGDSQEFVRRFGERPGP